MQEHTLLNKSLLDLNQVVGDHSDILLTDRCPLPIDSLVIKQPVQVLVVLRHITADIVVTLCASICEDQKVDLWHDSKSQTQSAKLLFKTVVSVRHCESLEH